MNIATGYTLCNARTRSNTALIECVLYVLDSLLITLFARNTHTITLALQQTRHSVNHEQLQRSQGHSNLVQLCHNCIHLLSLNTSTNHCTLAWYSIV
jgi:hypothetical protein